MNTFKPTSHPAFSIRHRHLHVPRHQIAHEDLAAAQQRGTREALREAVGKDAEAQQLILGQQKITQHVGKKRWKKRWKMEGEWMINGWLMDG